MKRVLQIISLALLLALILPPASAGVVLAAGLSWTQTTEEDFEAGVLNNVDTSTSPGDVTLAQTHYIYALQGGGTMGFWRYDIANDNWTAMAGTSDNVSGGGALTYDGTYIYALQGKPKKPKVPEDPKGFWRYDIASDNWTAMADTPDTVEEGGALVKAAVYITPGTLASQVHDTGVAGTIWNELSWEENLPANTDITFEVRANDVLFDKNAATPKWINLETANSSITSGLPPGQYMQWRASLSTSNDTSTPTLPAV